MCFCSLNPYGICHLPASLGSYQYKSCRFPSWLYWKKTNWPLVGRSLSCAVQGVVSIVCYKELIANQEERLQLVVWSPECCEGCLFVCFKDWSFLNLYVISWLMIENILVKLGVSGWKPNSTFSFCFDFSYVKKPPTNKKKPKSRLKRTRLISHKIRVVIIWLSSCLIRCGDILHFGIKSFLMASYI